ncbi:MAG: hypothetical protein RJB34_1782 [Pseudomonadota bacterium]|jgi:hypothetical protein
MDFFKAQCQSGPFTQEKFGVCDDKPAQAAYIDTGAANADKRWIATVENEGQIPVTFTAIDKCVIQDGDALGRGRCDAMLTTSNSLFLLELKERKVKSNWRKDACDQLESTILFLMEHHPNQLQQFTRKKAQACNRKQPRFAEIEQELKRRFRNYGFQIDTQATVVVIS